MTVSDNDLRERLVELIPRHQVPAAQVAVLAGGEVTTAAAGVLNLDTGVEATSDSLFQIGSITKLYTASLVMQLVDEGRVDLDTPAITYLPELRLGDPVVTEAVTLRHLLTHSSGIAGDHFPELGRGDDVVARYVASLAELGQTHPRRDDVLLQLGLRHRRTDRRGADRPELGRGSHEPTRQTPRRRTHLHAP